MRSIYYKIKMQFRVGRESCYFTPAQTIPGLYQRNGYTNENTIIENATQHCAPSSFLGRGQTEPFHNEQNPIWTLYYSDANIKFIQDALRARGFNPAPSRNDIAPIMDRAFEARGPWGVGGAFLTCDVTNYADPAYVRDWLQMLNKAVIGEVSANMAVHRWANDHYYRDATYFVAPQEIAQPVMECDDIRKGGSVYMDGRLPNDAQIYSPRA